MQDLKQDMNNMEQQKEENEDIQSTGKKKGSFLKDILDMALYVIVVLAVVAFIYHFVGQQVEVNGSSMENTLSNNDRLILEKISYRFGEPKRFDIIVFRPYEDEKSLYYIKRIIGLPGETVQIKGKDIFINGRKLKENYGREEIEEAGNAAVPITLGEDEYFVLGDNRNNSTDSRFEVGTVKESAILGRTFARIWPLNEMKILEHQ